MTQTIMVLAARNVATHRGVFVVKWRASRVPHRLDIEWRVFDLATQWKILCDYFDGWTSREMAAAHTLRRKIFEQFGTSTIELASSSIGYEYIE